MCNHCSEDPRDGMHGGLRALSGLCELLVECSTNGRTSFEVVNPQNLAELVSLVDERLQRAGLGMENYMPRV